VIENIVRLIDLRSANHFRKLFSTTPFNPNLLSYFPVDYTGFLVDETGTGTDIETAADTDIDGSENNPTSAENSQLVSSDNIENGVVANESNTVSTAVSSSGGGAFASY